MTQTQHQARTWKAVALSAICAASFALWGTQPARGLACVGDCDGNGMVSVNELIVKVLRGGADLTRCPINAPSAQTGEVD